MNSDFPRIITLLRKERSISQKQAAADLNVSQALLSHYEKGIRECGLEFLVKISDYYGVSCDYLLGRSPEPTGRTISIGEPSDASSGEGGQSSGSRKILINSINLLYAFASKTGSRSLVKGITSCLTLSVYRLFRILYSSNSSNDRRFFTIPEACCGQLAAAAMANAEATVSASAAGIALGGGDTVESTEVLSITTASLSEEYPDTAASLLNLIKSGETVIASEIGRGKTSEQIS